MESQASSDISSKSTSAPGLPAVAFWWRYVAAAVAGSWLGSQVHYIALGSYGDSQWGQYVSIGMLLYVAASVTVCIASRSMLNRSRPAETALAYLAGFLVVTVELILLLVM